MRHLLLTPARRRGRPPMRVPVLSWPTALAIVVLLHALSLVWVRDLRLNNAPQVYYTPGTPAVLLREELLKHFPTDEVLTLAFQGPDLYEPAQLKRIEAFTRRMEADPRVDKVMAITSAEQVRATADGFEVGRLVDPGASEPAATVRRRVLADRFAPGTLASKDGTVLAVVVRPKPLAQSGERLELKLLASQAMLETGLAGRFAGDAGPVTLEIAQLQSMVDDSRIFVPMTLVIGLALMWWVVGRWRPMVIGAVAISTVLLPTLALVAATGQPYTMVTAILPSLLSAYTLATLLHLYASVQQGHAARLSRGRALDEALSHGLKPGAFNVLTTSAGLLSLWFVPIPPIQAFGCAGAFGTLMVFIVVYILVPPFLRHWDNRRWPNESSGLGRFGRWAPKLALFSMRHAGWVLGIAAAAVALGIPAVRSVKAESDLLAFFKPTHAVSVDTRFIESKLSGVSTLEVLVRGNGPDSLQRLDVLAAMRDLQRWIDAQPEVDRSLSFADTVEEMNVAMHGDDKSWRRLPDSDRQLRQYLLVYDGKDMFDLVNRDFSRARIVVSMHVHGAQEIGAVIRRLDERLAAKPFPKGTETAIGGEGRLFTDQSMLLIDGQANSFASAFAQIFVFMLVLWRSIVGASVCMLPNLAPLYFVFVLMGALGIYLDTATVMIAGIVLGITVDDTIHLFHGWRERRRAGLSATWAVARCFQATGPAVMAISVLLISQFLLLSLSDFIPTSNFGLMTAVGLFSGQIFEMMLTPALLVVLDRWLGRRQRPQVPAEAGAT